MRIPPNLSSQETIDLTYKYACQMVAEGVPGNFVECGVAAGNNLAAMCLAGRIGFGFDSFEGIPWAGEHDTIQPGMSDKPVEMKGESSGVSVYSIESVHENMQKWDVSNYVLVKGWFKDTLPDQKWVKEIAVLRLDGDLYESTFTALAALFPLLSKGGILIMDDWILPGCRKAFEHYFYASMVGTKLELILDNGVTYWKK